MTKYIPIRGLRSLNAKVKQYQKLMDLKESDELDIRGYFGYVSVDNVAREIYDSPIFLKDGAWMTAGNYGGGYHVISRIGEGHINIDSK